MIPDGWRPPPPPPGWQPLPPPPPGWEPPPPQPGTGPAVAAAIVFVLVGLLPTFFFVSTGFGDDETATASAAGEVFWLSAMALAAGVVGGAITWGVARGRKGGLRSAALTVLVLLAGAWGVVTGFLGAVVISMARHPTWDDA